MFLWIKKKYLQDNLLEKKIITNGYFRQYVLLSIFTMCVFHLFVCNGKGDK